MIFLVSDLVVELTSPLNNVWPPSSTCVSSKFDVACRRPPTQTSSSPCLPPPIQIQPPSSHVSAQIQCCCFHHSHIPINAYDENEAGASEQHLHYCVSPVSIISVIASCINSMCNFPCNSRIMYVCLWFSAADDVEGGCKIITRIRIQLWRIQCSY